MPDISTICESAARAGGEVLLRRRHTFTVHEKAPGDLVTEADIESQNAIRRVIFAAFPDHDFLGEEEVADSSGNASDASQARSSEYRWIVDPLDGTTNFVHGMDDFAVSIAVQHAGDIIFGCVYAPVDDKLYIAQRGKGAFLNGKRLETSQVYRLRYALVAASLPPIIDKNAPEVGRFIDIMCAAQALRRLGSAALNLSYLAEGKLDAYFATSVKIWDVAAGLLLVREAGGVVTSMEGGPLDLEHPRFVAAAGENLHRELVAALAGNSI